MTLGPRRSGRIEFSDTRTKGPLTLGLNQVRRKNVAFGGIDKGWGVVEKKGGNWR